jgi:hypothetical protein
MDGRIILKWIIRTQGSGMWIRFMWPALGMDAGSYEHVMNLRFKSRIFC